MMYSALSLLLLASASVSALRGSLQHNHHIQHDHHIHHVDEQHQHQLPQEEQRSCLSTFQELQSALNALPTTTTNHGDQQQQQYTVPKLQICADSTIEITDGTPLVILERSVHLSCAGQGQTCKIVGRSSDNNGNANGRLVEVIGTTAKDAPNTVVTMTNLVFAGGDSSTSGGALYSIGASLVLQDCVFHDNVAQQRGGAVHAHDGGRAVVLVLANTRFYDNLSLDDHCMSVYWEQLHDGSRAELNTELDSSLDSVLLSTTQEQRQLQKHNYQLWDDPAHAALELTKYHPKSGATLCL